MEYFPIVHSTNFFRGDSCGQPCSQVVDIYDSTSNTWSIANLSLGRASLAATTVGNLAFFAGGFPVSDVIDIYNFSSNTWTVASLSIARYELAAASVGELVFFAGGTNGSAMFNVVDIYNLSSNSWTTASLSQARCTLVATSLKDLVFFAGGTDYISQLARSGMAATSLNSLGLAFFAGGLLNEKIIGTPIAQRSDTIDVFSITIPDSIISPTSTIIPAPLPVSTSAILPAPIPSPILPTPIQPPVLPTPPSNSAQYFHIHYMVLIMFLVTF